jgi:hypothetical protein
MIPAARRESRRRHPEDAGAKLDAGRALIAAVNVDAIAKLSLPRSGITTLNALKEDPPA